jgi:hypothetical protein
VIGTSEPLQLSERYQDPRSDSSRLQLLVRYQVIKGPLTDGEQIRGLSTANEQLALLDEGSSLGRLL